MADSPYSVRTAEGQPDVAMRNFMLSRVDADRQCSWGHVPNQLLAGGLGAEGLGAESVAECFLLQDKGNPGWQDFFDDISVKIVAELFVSQLD